MERILTEEQEQAQAILASPAVRIDNKDDRFDGISIIDCADMLYANIEAFTRHLVEDRSYPDWSSCDRRLIDSANRSIEYLYNAIQNLTGNQY